MSPKPDVSEERKIQIIEAAIQVFAREGFHQARMDDIAREAGLSKGAIYWYFKSKDKIIAALVTSFFDREFSIVEEWVNNADSARNILQDLSNLVVKDLVSVKPFMPIMHKFWAISQRNNTAGKVIRDSMHRYIEMIVPIIQRGIDEGEFKDLDALDLAMAYGAIIEGSILLWSYDMNNLDFQKLITQSVTIFLDGIENPKKV